MELRYEDILQLEDRYRRNLMNSLHGLRPALLLGTRSADGLENLAIFSQILHVGAHPPLTGVLFRPDSVDRHSLENIRQTGYFTLNTVASVHAAKAHQTSARYPRETSEFTAVGLEPEYRKGFIAPFVKDAPIKLGLCLRDELPLHNGTLLITGSVELLWIDDTLVETDGFVNHQKADSLSVAGLDAYFRPEALSRFRYAKPDVAPQPIKL